MSAMTTAPTTTGRVRTLPNDIHVVTTGAGDILVNSPPETLKYLLAAGLKPPKIVLLPPDIPPGRQMGSSGFVRHGVNYASIEFIMYANFFMAGGQRTQLLTVTNDQARRLRVILDETVSGPLDPDAYGSFNWLQAECAAVSFYQPRQRGLRTEDMVDISSLEEGGGNLGSVEIRMEGENFVFRENGIAVATVSTQTTPTPLPPTVAPPQPLLRHELTLQFVGASHGFDPIGITTCFLGYFGTDAHTLPVLFDCAAYLRIRLGNLGVALGQIEEVVLSHLHEDHLAGLPDLLLWGEGRVRLITSDIVYQGLLRVMGAMLAISEAQVATLFEYQPLNPGTPLVLGARRYEAVYAVHTIPTIAVRVDGLCYSGDMRYDETWFAELEAQGIISSARYSELAHFAEGSEVLVQDVGGGSVHSTLTPALLEALAAKSRRVVLAHTSDHHLPEHRRQTDDEQVEFADSGHIVAIGAAVATPQDEEQAERVTTFCACPLYARLPIEERTLVAQEASLTDWPSEQVIVQEGDPWNGYAYVVHSGLVEVWAQGKRLQLLGRGSSIGERGALKGDVRSATLIARGSVQLLGLGQKHFQAVAGRLGLVAAFDRADWLWHHPAFGSLPWATLLDLALDFKPRVLHANELLFSAGELADEGFLLISGSVSVTDQKATWTRLVTKPGALFGGHNVLSRMIRDSFAVTREASEVWAVPSEALQRLSMMYPQVALYLQQNASVKLGSP